MEYAVTIENVRKEFKGFTLKNVSFRIPKGYVMGLIGPNGAGKTTLIKLIMNLVRKNSGSIQVFGKDHILCEPDIKSRIGFVYDVPHFYEDTKLKTMASAIAPFYPKWDQSQFLKLMREFDLPQDKKFKKLSHGMKMKFSLCLALSHDADLILMDEPTSGLDPVFRQELLERLSQIMLDEKKTVLFSTHITSDLERIADYITFINNGDIIFSSSLDQILENWGIIKAGKNFLDETEIPGLTGYEKTEYGIEILTSDIKKAQTVIPSDSVTEKATLEDIMYFIKKGDSHA
ncbi:MAG: ATP-binding cassette domain-containing protein [Candidatus Aminicenantes bacterium]|nr:ATP-binding cassette domain-containing protein [Candidatus Aminicenantes bacterium]